MLAKRIMIAKVEGPWMEGEGKPAGIKFQERAC
jgi:hypothetical protein